MRYTFPTQLLEGDWDAFPLSWRFRDLKYDPPWAYIHQIRPLSLDSARRVADWIQKVALHEEEPFTPALFSVVHQIQLQDLSDGEGAKALLTLQQRTDKVIVSWDEESAVETTWETLATCWSTFFYQGSDDVTIIGPRAEWAALIHHDGIAYVAHASGA